MHGGCGMNCKNPIEAAVLADYWLALLSSSEEDALELHLLDCDDCAQRLREMIALANGVRNLAREGSIRMIVSDVFLQRAAEGGLKVREYLVPPGGSVECTVTAEDDLLIGRLAANLAGANRVDISICNENGVEQLRMPDIPVHSGTTSVACQESIRIMKAAPTSKMIMKLVTFDDKGAERTLGEYAFNHTRSLPGPGSW
jgi:hypothetical protein